MNVESEIAFVIPAARASSFKRCALNPMHLAWMTEQIKWLHLYRRGFNSAPGLEQSRQIDPSSRVPSPVLTAFPLDSRIDAANHRSSNFG